MKVLFLPRDPNPYQESLARELRVAGVDVAYAGEATPSHTLNLLWLPFSLLLARVRGVRVLHVHWVYNFQLPGSGRSSAMRAIAEAWYRLVLGVAGISGLRIVWTAHNVLPHAKVFNDDARARANLTRRSDAVIAHSEGGLRQLVERGWQLPSLTRVIRHGPVDIKRDVAGSADYRARWGIPQEARVVGNVGHVEAYKGVEELLQAFIEVADSHPDLWLLVAGRCRDSELRRKLESIAAQSDRVRLDLRFVPDEELGSVLGAADVMALPFRRITTSGSATAALNAGTPVMHEQHVGLDDLPAGAVHAYPDLASGLTWAATIGDSTLRDMSTQALEWSHEWTWSHAAAATQEVYREVVGS